MRQQGAIALRDYPHDTVRVRCDACGRAGRYPRTRLVERFGGDAGLPDVLRELADCARWRSAGEPCGAHYPDLSAAGRD